MLHQRTLSSRLLSLVLVVVLSLGLVACDDDSDPVQPTESETIADIVGDSEDFSTLLTALQEAGLAETFADEEATFTVFAPNEAAFSPIAVDVLLNQPEALEAVLGYHVIPDAEIAAADLNEGENTVTTLSGDELTVVVNDDGVFIEGSEVIQTDIEADNGIIHVLDRTLLGNQNLANVAWFVDETGSLYNAVVDAGLGEAVADADGWTVFGPNNTTFENADLSGFSESEIQEILQYHVFAEDVVDSGSLLSLLDDNNGEVTIETLQGENLTIAQDGDQIVFNDGDNGPQATLDTANLDYTASNGILHVIDGLLLPPSLQESTTIADVVADSDDFSTLLAALQEANLVDPLADEEATFTVFAPNNDGFAPINTDVLLGQPDALESVLGYHVIPDAEIAAADLNEGENTVTTLAGDELTVVVNDDGVFIEGSEVIETDIEADNGIIHVLNRTLLGNQNLANVAWFVSETNELYNAVVDFGLADAFVNAEGWTVFGPNNTTFENADLSGFSESEIQEILQYHVFAEDIVDSGSLLSLLDENNGEVTIATLQGEDLTITQDGDQIVFNDGQATLDTANLDYTASNGILHVIDGLLLPPSLQESTTIADVVADSDDFSTLLAALQEANLVDPLADEEATFTVFAPNNDGFAPINTDVLLGQPDALESVLGYHVIPDAEIAAADLNEGENTVTTLAGDELTVVVDDDGVFIEGSEVIQTDIEADNGIIHVLDRTLLGNQNLANVAWFVDETGSLYNAVVDAGLGEAVADADGWTVFGPNNTTFENADLSGFSESEIQEILQYHVFAEDIVDSGSLLSLLDDNNGEVTIETLQGENLTIAQEGDQIVFNDGDNGPQATLDTANLDYTASNGILHVIDGLLLPPSFTE